MLTCQIIQSSDRLQFEHLIKERPEVYNGYTDKEFQEVIIDMIPEILSNPLYFNVGIFFEDQLIAIGILKEMTTQPAWVWGYWMASKKFTQIILSNSKEILPLVKNIDELIFNEMEINRKLVRLYIAYPVPTDNSKNLRHTGNSDRFFNFLNQTKAKELDLRISTYKFYTDCTVEPGDFPKYLYQKQIIGDRIWPMKLEIRVGYSAQSKDNGSVTSPVSPSIT